MTGVDTRQTWLTTRLRGRIYHPSGQRPVELDFHESGSSSSREAFESNPPATNRGVILRFYPMHGPNGLRASGTRLSLQCGRSVLFKVGAEHQGAPNPPAGLRTKATMANRVKSSSGSGNARWRREPGGGNTDRPETDYFRGSAKNADREQLNDERGIKPLPVSNSRDGAESGKTNQDG